MIFRSKRGDRLKTQSGRTGYALPDVMVAIADYWRRRQPERGELTELSDMPDAMIPSMRIGQEIRECWCVLLNKHVFGLGQILLAGVGHQVTVSAKMPRIISTSVSLGC